MENSPTGSSIMQSGSNLIEFLETALSQNTQKCVARDGISSQNWTFADLSKQSATVANQIRSSSGIVALSFSPSWAYLVAVVSVIRLGRPYLAIEPNLPCEIQQRMLAETGASVFLHSVSSPPNLMIRGVEPFAVECLVANFSGESENRWRVFDQPIMCILYTSGSTNLPKAVQIPYSAVLNRLFWQWRTQPFGADDVVAMKTGIGFVDSIAELWAPLLKGVPLVTLPTSLLCDIKSVIKVLRKFRVTRITLVPTLLRSILTSLKEYPELGDLALKTVVSSGEELNLETCEAFFASIPHCQLHNYYGSTEVMGDVTAVQLHSIQDARAASYEGRISIGSAIDNTELIIHGRDGQGVGELFCTGASLAAGYLCLPTQSQSACSSFSSAKDFNLEHAKADENRVWFRTGDLVRISNGQIFFCGRHDDVIKIAGNKVNLSNVSRIVSQVTSFKSRPVIIYSAMLGKLVLLYQDSETIDIEKLSADLCLELPSLVLPVIVPVESFLFRPNSGKIDKRAMLARFEDDLFRDSSNTYDWNRMSHLSSINLQKLKDFVAILSGQGIRSTSLKTLLTSSFFTVGGTSLNVVSCLSQLRSHGMDISMQDFFAAKSIQGIFEKLVGSPPASSSSPLSVWTIKPLNSILAIEAWDIIASNMVDVEPAAHMWDDAKGRKACYDELLLILRTFEPFLLREPKLSFGVFDCDGSLVGVSCNIASDNGPEDIPSDGIIAHFTHFLDDLEAPLVAKLERESYGSIYMKNLFSVIDRQKLIHPAFRVKCLQFMEEEVVRVAQQNAMSYVITTNTSPVTRDIAILLGYEVDVVSNGFVDWTNDEGRPFVPFRTGDFDIQVCYKLLN